MNNADNEELARLSDSQRLTVMAQWLRESHQPGWCIVAAIDMERIAKRISAVDIFLAKLTLIVEELATLGTETNHNDLNS